jgi:hypothetical protein
MAASTLSVEERIVMRERVFAWMASDGGLVAHLIPASQSLSWSDEQERGWVQELVSTSLHGNEAAKNRVLIREAAAALRRAAHECAVRANGERISDVDLLAAMIAQLDIIWDLVRPDYVRTGTVGDVEDAYLAAQLELRTVHVLRVASEAFVTSDPRPDGHVMHSVLSASVADILIANAPVNNNGIRERATADDFKYRATEILDGFNSRCNDLSFLKWFEDKCSTYPMSALPDVLQAFLRKLDLDDCWIVHMHNLEKEIEDGTWTRNSPGKLPSSGQEASGEHEQTMNREGPRTGLNEVRGGSRKSVPMSFSKPDEDAAGAADGRGRNALNTHGAQRAKARSDAERIREPEEAGHEQSRVQSHAKLRDRVKAARERKRSPIRPEDPEGGAQQHIWSGNHGDISGLGPHDRSGEERKAPREDLIRTRTRPYDARRSRIDMSANPSAPARGQRRSIQHDGPVGMSSSSEEGVRTSDESDDYTDFDLDETDGRQLQLDDLGAQRRRRGRRRALSREVPTGDRRLSLGDPPYSRNSSRRRGDHEVGHKDQEVAGLEPKSRKSRNLLVESNAAFRDRDRHASTGYEDRPRAEKAIDSGENATTDENLDDSGEALCAVVDGNRSLEQAELEDHPVHTQSLLDMYDDGLEHDVRDQNDGRIKSVTKPPGHLTGLDHVRPRLLPRHQTKGSTGGNKIRSSRNRMREVDWVADRESLAAEMENEIENILDNHVKPDTTGTRKTKQDRIYGTSRGKRGRSRKGSTVSPDTLSGERSGKAIPQGFPGPSPESGRVENRTRKRRKGVKTRVNHAAVAELGYPMVDSESRHHDAPTTPERGLKVRARPRRTAGSVTEVLHKSRSGARNLYEFAEYEDRMLISLIRDYGYGKWVDIARTGKLRAQFRLCRTPSQVQHRALELAHVS